MSSIKLFLGSSTGLAVCVAAAALGLYLLIYHPNHVLLAVPYLFLLVCPLIHLMHRSHRGHQHNGNITREDRAAGQERR